MNVLSSSFSSPPEMWWYPLHYPAPFPWAFDPCALWYDCPPAAVVSRRPRLGLPSSLQISSLSEACRGLTASCHDTFGSRVSSLRALSREPKAPYSLLQQLVLQTTHGFIDISPSLSSKTSWRFDSPQHQPLDQLRDTFFTPLLSLGASLMQEILDLRATQLRSILDYRRLSR